MAKILEKAMCKTMSGLGTDIKVTEAQMKDVIDKDDDLRKVYALVASVVGIGFLRRWYSWLSEQSNFNLLHQQPSLDDSADSVVGVGRL